MTVYVIKFYCTSDTDSNSPILLARVNHVTVLVLLHVVMKYLLVAVLEQREGPKQMKFILNWQGEFKNPNQC